MTDQSTASTAHDQFLDLARAGRVIPVVRELFADGETPVGIYRKLSQGAPGTFLLESAEQGGIWSRFSFVGVSSFGMLTDHDGVAQWIDDGLSVERAFGGPLPASPLESLSQLYQRWQTPQVPGHPPLTGGLVGFIGWEAIRELEHLPNKPPAAYEVPAQSLCFVADLVVLDHKFGTVQLIANVLNDGSDNPEALWQDAQARLDRMQAGLSKPAEAWLADIDLAAPAAAVAATEPKAYLRAIETAKQQITQGEIFQVVISQRFDLECPAPPIDVYRILRVLNPSPYMYLVNLATTTGIPYAIVGSSPEALFRVTGSRVFTHPIAGSMPRGTTPESDADYEARLLSDKKERSEHLMLVDLSRNDLSKVCQAGSVEVTEFMRVEKFSHIMHLVSSVEGDLVPGMNAVDVFRATFPAGTLSGAPKPRALEIIDALEPWQRGVYGGVVGYLGFAGDADLAIAIRTATIVDRVAHVQAGGGIVADSDPESEFRESQNKAAAPLRAVAVAGAMRRVV